MIDNNEGKITLKQEEKQYWKGRNKLCVQCSKTCKQSDKVTVMSCKNYTITQAQGV